MEDIPPEKSAPLQHAPLNNKALIALPILSIVVALGSIGFAFVTYNQAVSVKESFANLQSDFDSLSGKFSDQQQVNEQLLNAVLYSTIEHDMEGAVVTDNFYIHKISFWDTITELGTSGTTIDIDVQPPMILHYEGLGKFDVSDRELRGMVQDLLEQASAVYESQRAEYLDYAPKWEDLEHLVTIQNYEIGTYKNGEFVLKGE